MKGVYGSEKRFPFLSLLRKALICTGPHKYTGTPRVGIRSIHRLPSMDQQNDRHVVDIELGCTGAGEPAARCCAGDRSCSVCGGGADCPAVIVVSKRLTARAAAVRPSPPRRRATWASTGTTGTRRPTSPTSSRTKRRRTHARKHGRVIFYGSVHAPIRFVSCPLYKWHLSNFNSKSQLYILLGSNYNCGQNKFLFAALITFSISIC